MVPRVSVIIVNWHAEDLVGEALAALDRQTRSPDRVILVDNGSGKPLPLARYTRGPVLVLSMPENVGFAAANNAAARRETDAEWLALLNPDALPEPDWLASLMEAAAAHPECQFFGSTQLTGQNGTVIDGLGDIYHVSGAAWRGGHGERNERVPLLSREIFAPCAAAALYRRDAFLDVGGFDEDFFCYFEDVDLGFRLRLRGYCAMHVPGAVVHHLGGGTTGGGRSDFAVYHGQRNLVWAFVKNMPGTHLWRYFVQHLLFNLASLTVHTLRGQGLVALRAKWAALAGLRRMVRKRALVRGQTKVPPQEVIGMMAHGWLMPYLRMWR
jgi:GT2 family glycosyltransferase